MVVGPCSIHDPDAAKEYAARRAFDRRTQRYVKNRDAGLFLKAAYDCRVEGLINDPHLDQSFQVNKDLISTVFWLIWSSRGAATGCEFLDTISPQFIADLVSWGAIGARTTKVSSPRVGVRTVNACGLKNGTDGTITIATDAVQAASHSHHFLSVTKQGVAAILVPLVTRIAM